MSKYAWPTSYCHGNDQSYRYVQRWDRKPNAYMDGFAYPYLSLVGPFERKDGTKGWSVAWMLWNHPSQIVTGYDQEDIEPLWCRKCGFIFQGVIT